MFLIINIVHTMKNILLRNVFSAFIALSFCVYAQLPDSSQSAAKPDSAKILDKMVVTASRTKRLLSETPASASIITKNTISSSPANAIEDLLITQTGIQAKRSAGIGEGIPSDIIIRGIPGALASPRTLILVDGIPTNVSGTPFLIVNEVPLDAIERIEIVRGPYSSLYGANAFGGVVNILTQEGNGKFHGNFTSETSYPFTVADRYFSENESASEALKKSGGISLWGVNGTGSGGSDKAGYLVSGGYRTIGNYLLRDYAEVKDPKNPDTTCHKKADNYGYTDYRLFGKAKYYPSENSELSLNVRYFNSDLGVGKTKNIIPDSQDIITKGEKILVGPQAKVTVSDWFTVHASGFFRHVTGEFWNEGKDSAMTPIRTYWKSQTNDWQIESQGFLFLGSGNTVTTGVEFLRNSADFGATVDPATGQTVPNSFPAQKAIVNGAGYVQDEWKPFEGLNIVPVARLDYHSVFGGAFSPKLGVSYKPLDFFRVRASAGRSFRAPSLAELYLPDLQINPSFLLKANPGLKPEYIWGFDGGIDVKAHENVTITLGGFYNTMDNLISQAVAQDSSTTWVTHRNVTSAWSRGMEMEASWKALSWLTAAGHATLENSLDKTYNVPLDYVPDLLFGCSAIAKRNFKGARIEGQAVFNYVGARSYLDFTGLSSSPQGTWGLAHVSMPQHPYGTVDLSCKVTLSKGLWFALTAQNVLNAEYEEAGGTFAPGRLALIKVGLDF